LKEGVVVQNDGSKLIYKYIVDDSARKIRVGLYNSKLDYIFANTSNISNASLLALYNATGRLYFWQNILLFEVSSITPAKNITRDVPKTTIVNETITDYTPHPAYLDLEKGIKRIFH
jgi:hypothetical protein